MAILWERRHGDNLYQVRSAGKTVRLYTDGVLHSQYNPNHVVTGNVWDLLVLPALFYPQGRIRRVLLLGLGGGAVVHLLKYFVAPESITTVELNPVHLKVARRFFDVDQPGVTLVEGDAKQWLEEYDGPPFDLIIEDLFGEQEGEPSRAVPLERPWCETLIRHLNRGGALVLNTASTREMMYSACIMQEGLRKRFKSLFRFTTPQASNSVVALLRREAESSDLRQRLKSIPELDPRRSDCRLRYAIRKI